MDNPEYSPKQVESIHHSVINNIVKIPHHVRLPEGLIDNSVNNVLTEWNPNMNVFGDSFLRRGNSRGIGGNVDKENLDVNKSLDYLRAARCYEAEYKESRSPMSLNKFKIAYTEAYHATRAASDKNDVNSKLCVARFAVLNNDAVRMGLLKANEKKDIAPQKQTTGMLGFFKSAPAVQHEMTTPELLKKIDLHLTQLWQQKSQDINNDSYIHQHVVLSAAKQYLSGNIDHEELIDRMNKDLEYKTNDTPTSATTLSLIDEVLKIHPFPHEEDNLRPGY